MSEEADDMFIQERDADSGAPDAWNIEAILGRPATAGLFVNADGTGIQAASFFISINNGPEQEVKVDEVFSWGNEARKLLVKKIRIRTTANQHPYRLWCW